MEQRLSSLLLLVVLLTVGGHPDTVRGFPQGARQRFPRRDNFLAYNIHRTFTPRDINDLDINQAQKAMVDVQQTIAEVQRLLARDPTLPRLTRGEIEELFENVTREELEKSIRQGDQTRAQHMRALMLVLPYHTSNMSPENLQNIYAMPPVTRLVNNDEPSSRPKAEGFHKPTPPRDVPTTTKPVFRMRSTTKVPITTIRFSTPKPTTFHPSPPRKFYEDSEVSPTVLKPINSEVRIKPIETTTPGEEPIEEDETVGEPNASKTEEISEILASIGILNGVPPSFKRLPAGVTTPIEMASTAAITTATSDPTTTPATPTGPKTDEEFQKLLLSFGLLNGNDEKNGVSPIAPVEVPQPLANDHSQVEKADPPKAETVRPAVNPADFIAFKPLPPTDGASSKLNEELDQLLKSFGLLDGEGRNKKSLKLAGSTVATPKSTPMGAMPVINRDLVMPQMASVLNTLGIQTTQNERIGRNFVVDENSNEVDTESSMAKTNKVNNEDYRKLEQLWETIRELERLNENLTDDSLDSLNLRNFNLSESLYAQGPNPLENFELTRTNYIKKRQEPSEEKTPDSPIRISLGLELNNSSSPLTEITSKTTNESSSTTTSEVESLANQSSSSATEVTPTESSSTTTTTTTESTARISALEESFGGGADPVAQEPLPQPRRNGFYFLADWNSFLEVGEEPNRVVISFRPQAGDPSRFLPVNVP
ncbi:mucin-2 [Toxorhynchites rutilus septentrionalis]|uniref:mucin-2 n=1 Tax=Toxorhynchites rutilus septentrionalis TaxID=329112 RepID=UPI00247A1437|nr:mucin-2 [Toxorhynchites rutilus septentrionalis]